MIGIHTISINKRWLLLGVIILASFFRLFYLDMQSFFHDEAVEYDIASRSVMHISTIAYDYDAMPPGSFLLLHFWLFLGQGDFWSRFLFALAGVANVAAIFLLGRELLGFRRGVLAALLMSVNPFHIWYSQDLRPYVFLMLFCTLHVWLFLLCMRENHWRNWVGFGGCALAALYSHPFAAFTLGAEFLFALITVRDRKFWTVYLLTGAFVTVSFLPYVFIKIMGLSETVIGNPKPLSWVFLPFAVYSWLFGFSVGPSLAELHWRMSALPYIDYIPWMLPTLLGIGFLLWGWLRTCNLDQQNRRTIAILAIWAIIPLLMTFSLAKLTKGTFNVRYACEAYLPFTLLLAHGVDNLLRFRKSIGILALILLLAGSGISLGRLYASPKYWKEDVRSAGKLLSRSATSDDIIIVPETYAFRHYYTGSATIKIILELIAAEDNLQQIASLNAKHVWLVYYREWMMDPDHKIMKWFNRHWKLVYEYSYPNCKVFCYQPQ